MTISDIIARAKKEAQDEVSRVVLNPSSQFPRDIIAPVIAELLMNAQYEEIEFSSQHAPSDTAYWVYFDAELAREAHRLYTQLSNKDLPVSTTLIDRIKANGIMLNIHEDLAAA